MAIRFTFELSDLDAETLFGIIQNEICRMNENITREMAKDNNEGRITWYRGHIIYIEGIRKKMLANQERVKNER